MIKKIFFEIAKKALDLRGAGSKGQKGGSDLSIFLILHAV